ncbi:MAG: choice-of-anchor D domain-containing protein [Candidatus Marinimicrobia bacterium]|jgi:hypothetical protein|nr:choice-of-anchor D domain-containing protein [Candidatus Neomarinimicrobiota bacterium]MBT4036040.1 choice-of-anchor D domain-containing protein [Candidatus Neomarinimicrobiota bacterium]MBT4295424.1 choice-of-anchor D domain-containing protein [Candidatus Neomarinimicrobiota bacterium]MBT4945079.1 choice-of-anchor D domain-containing protein [Candidatus Neomarinimicrobiota bacterium]MBT5271119.1 choice-of-anchor D domain-containing protein [Candidatus Neomarinimicrobiota bacterium]
MILRYNLIFIGMLALLFTYCGTPPDDWDGSITSPTWGENGSAGTDDDESGDPVLGPLITVSTNAIDFGSVALGGNAQMIITISNTGDAILTPITISEPSDSPIGLGSFANQLAPGASMDVIIQFDPEVLGTHSETVNIASNAPSSPHEVAVTGTGVLPGFGRIVIGSGSLRSWYNAITPIDAAISNFSHDGWCLSQDGSITGSTLSYTVTYTDFEYESIVDKSHTFYGGTVDDDGILTSTMVVGANTYSYELHFSNNYSTVTWVSVWESIQEQGYTTTISPFPVNFAGSCD